MPGVQTGSQLKKVGNYFLQLLLDKILKLLPRLKFVNLSLILLDWIST